MGGDAAGLGAADFGGDAKAGFEAHLGELGCFAGAGFAGDDDDLVVANGGDEVVFARGDGKVGWVGGARDGELALLAKGDGGAELGEQAVVEGGVLIGMVAVADEADGARAEACPIGEHGLREEGLQFFDLIGGHCAGAE